MATASRMQLRRCGESPGRRTDKERRGRPGRHRPGAAADPIVALAMAGRTQHRCRGKSSGHGTDDTADHHGRHVRRHRPRSRAAGSRRRGAAVSVDEAAVSRRRKSRSGSHGPAAPIALQRTGGPPLWMRAGGTPYACRAQPDQIYRDRNSFPAEPAGYSPPGNGPFLPQPTGTRQKICDRGRLPWRNPA